MELTDGLWVIGLSGYALQFTKEGIKFYELEFSKPEEKTDGEMSRQPETEKTDCEA